MDEFKNKDVKSKNTIKDYLIYSIIILAVVGFGTLAVNQTLEYYYRAEFLKDPCGLCKELNPFENYNSIPGYLEDNIDYSNMSNLNFSYPS